MISLKNLFGAEAGAGAGTGGGAGAAIQVCGPAEPEPKEIFSAPQHCFQYITYGYRVPYVIK